MVVDFGPNGEIKGISCITSDSLVAHALATGYNTEQKDIKSVYEVWNLVESEGDLSERQKEVYQKGVVEMKKQIPHIVEAISSTRHTLTNEQIELLIHSLQKLKSL